jgi:hypothetical protein
VLPFPVFYERHPDFPSLTALSYPLCFDNHAKPSSRISFPLITIQNAPGVVLVSLTKGSFSSQDSGIAPVSPAFATLAKTPGVYPNYSRIGTHSPPALLSLLTPLRQYLRIFRATVFLLEGIPNA